ncbi:hypothetical protein ACWC9U_36155 [Streptomyces sp. 900116325]
MRQFLQRAGQPPAGADGEQHTVERQHPGPGQRGPSERLGGPGADPDDRPHLLGAARRHSRNQAAADPPAVGTARCSLLHGGIAARRTGPEHAACIRPVHGDVGVAFAPGQLDGVTIRTGEATRQAERDLRGQLLQLLLLVLLVEPQGGDTERQVVVGTALQGPG